MNCLAAQTFNTEIFLKGNLQLSRYFINKIEKILAEHDINNTYLELRLLTIQDAKLVVPLLKHES